MHFKLIIALVDDDKANQVMEQAREEGATGATVISNARGEGLDKPKTFLGLNLEAQRELLLFVVEEHLSRNILESIARTGGFEDKPGTGIAFQIDIEDAIGLSHQMRKLSGIVEEEI